MTGAMMRSSTDWASGGSAVELMRGCLTAISPSGISVAERFIAMFMVVGLVLSLLALVGFIEEIWPKFGCGGPPLPCEEGRSIDFPALGSARMRDVSQRAASTGDQAGRWQRSEGSH